MKAKVSRNFFNAISFKTKKPIIVFESDDWGSIRTPNLSTLEELRCKGIKVDKCKYMVNDALENKDDLLALFDLLTSHKNENGQSPKFTANTIVANPDFFKIKQSNFSEYFYKPFFENYTDFNGQKSETLEAFLFGAKNDFFRPQLHGREHINISRWMRDLRLGNPETKLAFDLGMTGISAHVTNSNRGSYQAAFDCGKKELLYDFETIISDACNLFYQIFGFYSDSFIAPNYVWNNIVEDVLKKNNVKFLQGSTTQKFGADFKEKPPTKKHFTGQRNRNNQIYLVRNASFEPSLETNLNAVDVCLKQIENAFFWKTPAIISTHRVNYIGSINQNNATRSLEMLQKLLKAILKKWPQVDFYFSDELGSFINKKYAK